MNTNIVNRFAKLFLPLAIFIFFSCNGAPKIALQFDTTSQNTELMFWYERNENNQFLDSLRSLFPIDSLIQNAQNDTERVIKIQNWVHRQWRHDGNNQPTRSDAISILKEAQAGANFRCVEYAIVATAALNSVGLISRTVFLKTEDVETRQFGAGHVVTEVFLNDLQRWVFIDPQFDVMLFLNGVPLNAVELQQAIAENLNELEIRTSRRVSRNRYARWIFPYLHFFSFNFDNREGVDNRERVDGQRQLMLVPLGANRPTVFQRRFPLDDILCTHSLKDFYAPPK